MCIPGQIQKGENNCPSSLTSNHKCFNRICSTLTIFIPKIKIYDVITLLFQLSVVYIYIALLNLKNKVFE